MIKIFRMQVALVHHSHLVVFLDSVPNPLCEKDRLDHKFDTRKPAGKPVIDGNGPETACLNKTNMRCHSDGINTPKHSLLFYFLYRHQQWLLKLTFVELQYPFSLLQETPTKDTSTIVKVCLSFSALDKI